MGQTSRERGFCPYTRAIRGAGSHGVEVDACRLNPAGFVPDTETAVFPNTRTAGRLRALPPHSARQGHDQRHSGPRRHLPRNQQCSYGRADQAEVLDLLQGHRIMTQAALRPVGWPQARTVGNFDKRLKRWLLCDKESK